MTGLHVARPTCANSRRWAASAASRFTRTWAAAAWSTCGRSASTSRWSRDSLAAGVDLVSFSGDKLLGGPQAGILAGRRRSVARLRRNPLFRALRLDKLIYQALETTLRDLLLERWERVPALRMIRQTADEIRERARGAAGARARHSRGSDRGRVGDRRRRDAGAVDSHLADRAWIATTSVEAERKLRAGDPPVVARIEDGRLMLGFATVFAEEEDALLAR